MTGPLFIPGSELTLAGELNDGDENNSCFFIVASLSFASWTGVRYDMPAKEQKQT